MAQTLMKCSFSLVLALILALVGTIATAPADAQSDPAARSPSLSELLEKAIFTEETLGDLDAAIDIYREILDRAETERGYIAQAHFRLGMCYLKKGQKDEAVAALQKLVEEFPKQQDLVAQARARLTELGFAPPEAGVQLRQVWANPGGILGSPSADGRYLTFTDWSSGDLAVHDLKTGQDRRLTRKGSWATPSFAEFSVLSPDGRLVAYAWFGGERIYELRVIGVDGSDPRILYGQEDTHWVQPIDWSPDGRRILSLLAKESGDQLAWISLEDGVVEPVGPARDYAEGRIDLSPDGRRVAFDDPQGDGTMKRDILLSDLQRGVERPLVEHPADDRVLGWSPDGHHLLFASDRTGHWGAWAIRVADGGPDGKPELLKAGVGQLWPSGKLFPLGFTRNGSFFYAVLGNLNEVYVADLAPDGAARAPAKVTQRFEGSNTAPEWSRDGKRLAWLSRREGGFTLVIRDLQTGDEREVGVSSRLTRIAGGIRWSPDGTSFLVWGMARPQESWQGIFSIDAETGDVTQIAAADPDGLLRHALWSPDGRNVYFERRIPDRSAVVSLDLESGTETTVHRGHVGKMALSSDGRQLAFTTDSFTADRTPLLRVVPTAGGEAREIFRSKESEPFHPETPLAFTPDGRHLVVGTGSLEERFQGNAKVRLWRIPVDGGPPVSLGLEMPHLVDLRVHPDGDRIAFEAGVRKPEIWLMENFLPEVVAER